MHRSVFLSVICALVSCVPSQAEPLQRPFKVGAVLALTSEQRAPNMAFVEGMEIAVDELKQRSPAAFPIELHIEDGRLLPKDSFNAAQKLLSIDKVQALILDSAVEAKAAAALVERRKIPALTLWDASPEIEALGDYILSIGLWTPGSASVAADYSAKQLRARRAVILNSQDEWSAELEKEYRTRFSSYGGSVLRTVGFEPSTTDFRAELTRVKAEKPDILYITVGYNFAALFRQIRELKLEVPIVTSDIISQSHLQADPLLYDGVFQTQIYTAPEGPAKRLLEMYKAKYARNCDWLPWVAWGYDAVQVLAQAAGQANDSLELTQELYKIKNFPGASGTISFTAAGSAPRLPSVFRIRGDTFELAAQ